MGRTKAAKNVPICPWASAKHDCREQKFLQVGQSLLEDPEYQSLKPATKNLYFCMCAEASGKRAFTFPLSIARKYGISSMTLRRGIDELIQKRFIALTSSGRLVRDVNFYEFISDWKKKADKPP